MLVASCLALAFMPALPVHAADAAPISAGAATGSLSGRVQNVVTGQYLNNARVAVRGTDRVAFTDQSGTYRLVQVPVGTVVL
jgi:iron complex outermembrane recepter protein